MGIHSLTSRRSAAAVPHGHARVSSSTIRINHACLAKPTAAIAKKPKRSGSFHDGDSPAKRGRVACGKVELDAATKTKIKTRSRPSIDEDRCLPPRNCAVEAICVTKNQASTSPILLPEAAAPSKPPSCTMSMRELLERARLAKSRSAAPAVDAEAVRRREIQRMRAEARREREQMVPTVEFNDPFIDFMDFFK